ncbi:MAG: glucosyl-3-phosphoglycerate synthase [Aggregatilineales bacterium]
MTTPAPYRIVIALSAAERLEAWVAFAEKMAAAPSIPLEIHLRAMLTMPEGVSLSEGTLQARQMRDALDALAKARANIHDETRVYVDYKPMLSVIEEIEAQAADLLIVEWAGALEPTGGISTDTILRETPCDVVLISRQTWQSAGGVLLSLRGGPNLSLGTRVASALAERAPITLLHVASSPYESQPYSVMLSTDARIARTVTVSGDIAQAILAESAGQKAIVMGAAFQQLDRRGSGTSPVVRTIFEQTRLPIILVRAHAPEEFAFHAPRPLIRKSEPLSVRVDRWFAENTFHSEEFADLQALLALKEKQGVTIGLALPALNEEQTVGNVIRTVKSALMDAVPLLDQIVLIDSDSTDNTVAIAQSLGIPTYKHPEILPEVGSYRGKGEALWKSLYVLETDIIAWIDTDITNIHPRFVYGLLGPLLKRANVQYVKGFYQRPIKVGEQLQAFGGGRVTELVARPLLNLFYPELSGVVQPLSGEYAGRRSALERVPFFSGYGVETGLLIDLHEQHGLEGIAQVDLEQRVHHNQPLVGLSKMSFAIHQVFISRLERRYGVELLDKANRSMKLIVHEPNRFSLDIAEISDVERPPMITVPAYCERFGIPS